MINERQSIGIGFLVIPEGVDRNSFIEQCYNKEKFVIMNENGELIMNVLCSKHVLNYLKFPKDPKEEIQLGSQVIYVTYPKQNVPIIIGILAKEGISDYYSESGFDNSKMLNDCSVGISGNLILRKLTLFCKSAIDKFCKLIISVSGNEESELSLESTGYVLTRGKTGIKIKGNNKEIILDKDKILITNTSEQNIKIDDEGFDYKDKLGNKFKLNKDGYILGNINFEKYITEILEFLGNVFILNTSNGPTGPGCSATSSGQKLQQLIKKIKDINKN